MVSKSGLAICLSKLEGFKEPKIRLEQYEMDAEIAAFVLWQANLIGDMGKVSVDLGCGTGILGIGALSMGSKRVYFVDSDCSAIEIAKKNLDRAKSEHRFRGRAIFLCQDIREFDKKADIVFENPPFGTKTRHIDVMFLEKAINLAPVVYSFHKSETKEFINRFCRKKGCQITHTWDFRFPIKASYKFHRQRIYRCNVSCFRIEMAKEL